LIRIAVGAAAAVGLALGLAALASAAGRPTPGAGDPDGRLVEVRGGRLHVVALGRADGRPPILLLHGASGNLRDMQLSIGETLSRRHRVILVDRPGHGRSDRLGGREMASPARQADAIVEALDRLGVKRVVAVGHSWSGALATNLALDHPTRVAGLVTLSGALHPYPGGAAWYNEIAATPLLGDIFTGTVVGPVGRKQFDAGVRSTFRPKEPPPDYIARTEAELLLRPAEFKANAEDLVDLKGFLKRQAPRYGEIRVPTTIITADKDGVVSPELHSRALHEQVAGSKLVVLKDAGHMPHWTEKARVVAEIEALAAKAR
jgi:pimeloyl-ACP methyl ester carboxylesterase